MGLYPQPAKEKNAMTLVSGVPQEPRAPAQTAYGLLGTSQAEGRSE